MMLCINRYENYAKASLSSFLTSAQCKRVHIFIAQFAIFRVFQEVNGS